MVYEQQEIDFVKRTQKLLIQYEEFICIKKRKKNDFKGSYETTLLINCCLGLLIVPKEKVLNELPKTRVNLEDWGISEEMIEIETNKTVRETVIHLRNSISHYHFKSFPIKGKIIGFEFTDKCNAKAKYNNFKIKLPLKNLKKFLSKLSNTMLKIMEEGQ